MPPRDSFLAKKLLGTSQAITLKIPDLPQLKKLLKFHPRKMGPIYFWRRRRRKTPQKISRRQSILNCMSRQGRDRWINRIELFQGLKRVLKDKFFIPSFFLAGETAGSRPVHKIPQYEKRPRSED